jgi:UDP-N-acetylmuramate dehydrogenase
VLFRPADVDDLARFLASKPADVPVTVIGVGSNLLIRDGGVPGVVMRLGRGFAGIAADGRCACRRRRARSQRRAARATAGLAGLEFLSGVPAPSAARCA